MTPKLQKQIIKLLKDCPLGHAHGHVMMPRHMTESDLVEWIDRLFAIKEQLREEVQP